MKKIVTAYFIASIFSFFIIPISSNANAEPDDKGTFMRLQQIAGNAGYEVSPDKVSIEQIVSTAIQALLALLGTVFLGLVVYGGFVWMQAKGEDAEIKRAQGMIKNGIIGMAIIIFAYAIAYFVIFRLQNATILSTPASPTP